MNGLERTDWMYRKKWGVMIHHLEGMINDGKHAKSLGKKTSWDEALRDFDHGHFAAQLHEAGAGWCLLTVMQCTKYMIAPNDTYNRITGYKPGEACASFDFIELLYEALSKYDIPLMLYFTGDGPKLDPIASEAFGVQHRTHDEGYVEKWAEVAKEYSLRYGSKIKGWWQDGMWYGFNDDDFRIFAEAFRAGNPDAVLASNVYTCVDEYGVLLTQPRKAYIYDDFTAGEIINLGALPQLGAGLSRKGKVSRWHILSFLGVPSGLMDGNGDADGWGMPGSKYTPGWMYDYIDNIHSRGGIITLDVCAYRDGTIDPDQMRVLRVLKTL